MEEVGTQVAPSIYIHPSLSGRFLESHPMAKKRSMPLQPTNFHLQQLQPPRQPQQFVSGFQDSREHWHPKAWNWDSARFLAKPLESDVLGAGTSTSVQSETQRSRDDETGAAISGILRKNHVGEDDESLLLQLGGGRVNSVEEPASRPNKRVRSGSPGGGNYPMCQVDNCKEDLSTAKDYHRRHKVCEVHSKATKALVGKQMQRFCQQCSRFHPLSEFDEGKRSCRRRLAGHNRRRRKAQPDDVTSRLLPPGNHQNIGNGDMDIVNLLAILARAQGKTDDSSTNCSSPNKDQLIQILQKINSLPLPMEERSPSSSPPIVQKLFPTQTSRDAVKPESISTSGEVTGNAKASRTKGCFMSLDLFGGSNRGADNGSAQSFTYQAGYTSSSGSDHSPSSLNSDAQIYNWLSQSPSEMESYIRPVCVVMSIYISMSSSAWEQFEDNLLQNVTSLVQGSDNQFWRNGRFLVHTGRQLASYLDGKVHLRKAWSAWSSPELISVSPLAVVGGQETSILLKGRNLSTHGTKVYCTHMVGYTLKENKGSACQDTVYDEITLSSFRITGAAPSVLGRCFIEVDNGFRGTSFPIIIANATICQELRLLESEFDKAAELRDAIFEEHIIDAGRPRSREDVLHFLNELGWLLQRKGIS